MLRLILASFCLLAFGGSTYAQKYSMLDMHRDSQRRWRVGHGINIGEPSGLQVSIYRFRNACRFQKNFSLEVNASSEGLLLGDLHRRFYPSWDAYGVRAGLAVLWYVPLYPFDSRPYLGVGAESGRRSWDNRREWSSDATARLGLEWYFFGARITRHTNLALSFFMEARYNWGYSHAFGYILPSVGLRFNYI